MFDMKYQSKRVVDTVFRNGKVPSTLSIFRDKNGIVYPASGDLVKIKGSAYWTTRWLETNNPSVRHNWGIPKHRMPNGQWMTGYRHTDNSIELSPEIVYRNDVANTKNSRFSGH